MVDNTQSCAGKEVISSGYRKGGDEEGVIASAKDQIHALIGSRLRTTLSDGRVVVGYLECMDRLTNFILADAMETPVSNHAVHTEGGETGGAGEGEGGIRRLQRRLGLVMIPGKHLVRVEMLEAGQ